MKRILALFTTAFVPTGGLTSVMMNYYRSMDKTNLSIDFASTNVIAPELLKEISNNGSCYFKLPQRKNIFAYWFTLIKLCKGYDVFHVHANSATALIELSAAKAAGVKIRIHHNHNSSTQHPILNALMQPFLKNAYTEAVACSKLAGDWLFGKENFKILHNAIDLSKFSFDMNMRNRKRKEFGLSEDKYIIGHVGKFNEAKNQHFLIQVFAHYRVNHPKAKLLLVGDGTWRSKIEKWVLESGCEKDIILAGLRTDIPDLLQMMDIFVFPSIYEGMPLSVLEAQTSGLPCLVSTNVTNDVKVGLDVRMKALADGFESWAEELDLYDHSMSREDRCHENYQLITAAGYNIKREANELLKLYGI